MSEWKFPGRREEEAHLATTLQWIKEEQQRLSNHREVLRQEIAEIRKTVSHLMDERLLAKNQLYQYADKDLKILSYAQKTPYFGRIDFKEKLGFEIETLYIGKHGLHDQTKDLPVVVDWRAPVADLYYSSLSHQDVSYRAPMGMVEGTLYLKRRFEIVDGVLKSFTDEKSTEAQIEDSLKGRDDFLVEALSRTSNRRLKEIVATIQDQQNRVIRSDMLRPLIVQGVAGSGKTTIALHRMAYLIYHHRRNFQEANYMVIAPNQLFLNYISEILPDLGVEDVVQTTFEAWAKGLIGKKLKVKASVDQLNQLMNAQDDHAQLLATAAKVKGSLRFKKVIDQELKALERKMIPNTPLMIDGIPVLSQEEILHVFLTSHLHLSLKERVKKLKEYLIAKVKTLLPQLSSTIEEIYFNQIQQLKTKAQDIETIRPEIQRLYEARDQRLAQLKKQIAPGVQAYIASLPTFNIFDFYQQIFSGNEVRRAFLKPLGEAMLTSLLTHIKQQLDQGIYENEDLAPLAYLHIRLEGYNEKQRYAHIVVDEAQDFDEMKLCVLREIVMNDSFTLVGDLSQGIYSYRGLTSWSKSMERVFKDRSYHYHILTTSYRSTMEIVYLANEMIKKCPDLTPVLAEPVFRHGALPMVCACEDEGSMVSKILHWIEELKQLGNQSIAVICKDLMTTRQVYEKIKAQGGDVYLLTEETKDFQEGVVVIPTYLSKGLEFDGVLVWNVNQENYPITALEVKLLYIAVTRALHDLRLLYTGLPSEILEGLEAFYHHHS